MKKKLKPTKTTEPTKLAPTPITIMNCNFNGSDSAGVLALARALEANAKAIEVLASKIESSNGPLLHIGPLGMRDDLKE
jgi:hypothetical protein